MKESMRAKRMARHHSRMHTSSRLNLVSLMDIFTILVFFLMVNSSDVQVLTKSDKIKLPDSIAERRPKETLIVMVNDTDIIVQGRKIIEVDAVMKQDVETIEPLIKELRYQSTRRPELTEQEQKHGRAITIMGDKKIPYALLKRVMTTCAKADYTNIALAVSKVPGEKIEVVQGG